MHYNIAKQVKSEYSYYYNVKLSRIKDIKEIKQLKCVSLANYHDQQKEIPQRNKRHFQQGNLLIKSEKYVHCKR
jgi:hypothetical protein